MGFLPSYQSEGRIYAQYLQKEQPGAKIAVLYQNDDFGKDLLKGIKDGFGDKAAASITSRKAYELTEPTVDFAYRQDQGQRRGRPDQHHDAEIRGADHQEDGRNRLEAAADRGQRLDVGRRGHEAGRLRERDKASFRRHYAKDGADAQWNRRSRA